jgi:hypothetical protein
MRKVNGMPNAECQYGESGAVRDSPDALRSASAWLGTGVTGKFTLPPAPTIVVEVDDVAGGMVVVGTEVAVGL